MPLHKDVAQLCQLGQEVRLEFPSGVTITGTLKRLEGTKRAITFVLDRCCAVACGVMAPAPETFEFTISTALVDLEPTPSGAYLVSNRSGLSVHFNEQRV